MTQRWPLRSPLATRAASGVLPLCCAFAAVAAVGCAGGTETGNPPFTSTLSYTGYSSRPSEVGLREGGSVATVESAWFTLDRISVRQAGSCETDATPAFSVQALGSGDHAAGRHNSTPYEARPGSFCGVNVPFVRVSESPEVPAELSGHAVWLAGKLADGTPFTIVSDLAPVVTLKSGPAAFALAEDSGNLLLAFDFATWLAGFSFAGAERSANAIVISDASNLALLHGFEAAIAPGIHLFRDRDGDGVLDADPEELAHAP